VDRSTLLRIVFLAGPLCLVSPAAATAQPLTLTASPTALSFTWQSGGALPAAQKLSIRASSGTPSYSIAITGSNTLWLTVTPETGKTPANLSVTVNPTGLSVGTYAATIVVTTSPAAAVSVPVTLVVSQPLPALQLSATTLSFTAPSGPVSQSLTLTTTGGPIPFTASATGANWIGLNPTTGVVLPGSQTLVTVTVDPSALSPQATPYAAKITIVATGVAPANRSQNVTVNLTVNPSPPTITSIWPSSVQAGAAGATITIRGTNFYKATTVKVSGAVAPATTITPTVLSSTAMLAVLPAAVLANPDTLSVTAVNPAPAGASPAATFTVSGAPVIQAVVNVASYQGGAVSPGELISLFGDHIGPATPVVMADADNNGFVDTSVGGVSVTIDSAPAPILYASENQISVQVPYEAATGTNKAIVVTNGSTTATAAVTITTQAPGLFSLDGSGAGQAAALNYNASSATYSLNDAKNPAHIGDTVVLYLTGEGAYAPYAQPTGLLTPAPGVGNQLPQMSPLPAVTIGGAPATVSYAGPVVGSILGLLQLNVVVPANSATGPAVPVSVTINGATTQTGITLAIHP
jgi:uncharacterized protein (TIGR03437 family)